MLQLSRQDIELISRRLLSEYLKKQITRIDKIDPVDFAEKMCGLRFAFADISVTGAVLGFTASMDVKVTISRRDGTQDDFVLDGKTAYIDRSLAAEGQTGRLNFTMMHEASHLLYARLFPSEYNGWQRRCVCRLADECIRFLYKGIIIKHNKTEPTYTKTSLFLCEKRRFFMGRTEKGGKVF